MKLPFVVGTDRTVIISSDAFKRIGRLDASSRILQVNVRADGKAGIEWILDAGGSFYQLASEGLLPLNVLQRLRLKRPREQLRIAPGRAITAGELATRIAGLRDPFDEAPNVTDLKTLLAALPTTYVLNREDMHRYLGE